MAVHRLLGESGWSADAVRDDLRDLAHANAKGHAFIERENWAEDVQHCRATDAIVVT